MYKPLDIITCPAAFCFYFSTLSSGGALVSSAPTKQEILTTEGILVHLTALLVHLIALLVHLRQVHPLKAPSAVQSDSLKRN